MTSSIVFETKYGKIISATPQTSGTTVFCRLPYTKKPSPIDPNTNPQRRNDVSNGVVQRLTVELSGRPEELRAHHSQFARSGRQAPSLTTVHGPLQRLLEDALIEATVRARLCCSKAKTT